MSPEEQLQVIEALAGTIKGSTADVRKEAFHCLIELGLDGLSRIIDVVDDPDATDECRKEAVEALGTAFSQGKVDKTGMIRHAIRALESCLTKDPTVCEAAVVAIGDIGTEAISAKPKLLALLDGKKDNSRICVKTAAALLKVSPVH